MPSSGCSRSVNAVDKLQTRELDEDERVSEAQ